MSFPGQNEQRERKSGMWVFLVSVTQPEKKNADVLNLNQIFFATIYFLHACSNLVHMDSISEIWLDPVSLMQVLAQKRHHFGLWTLYRVSFVSNNLQKGGKTDWGHIELTWVQVGTSPVTRLWNEPKAMNWNTTHKYLMGNASPFGPLHEAQSFFACVFRVQGIFLSMKNNREIAQKDADTYGSSGLNNEDEFVRSEVTLFCLHSSRNLLRKHNSPSKLVIPDSSHWKLPLAWVQSGGSNNTARLPGFIAETILFNGNSKLLKLSINIYQRQGRE